MATIDLWHLLRVIVDHVGAQAQRWATLLLSFSLFAYAVWKPDPYRIGAAALFTVLVHIPTWMRRDGEKHGRENAARSDARLESARARVNGESE